MRERSGSLPHAIAARSADGCLCEHFAHDRLSVLPFRANHAQLFSPAGRESSEIRLCKKRQRGDRGEVRWLIFL
jgi:hypothetical protein